MKLRKIMFAVGIAAIVTAGYLSGAHSYASEGSGARAIEGSWQVRLTPAAPQPAFDEFITFDSSGGIVESNNFPFFQMGLTASTGHGTWEYKGSQTFAFTFIKFLSSPGGHAGTLHVEGTLTYSPTDDTWSGPATVVIADPAGGITPLGIINGEATRISAE